MHFSLKSFRIEDSKCFIAVSGLLFFQPDKYLLASSFYISPRIFPHAIHRIHTKAGKRLPPAHSDIAVHAVGHPRRLKLASGLSFAAQTIFEQRLVHSHCPSILFQDAQPEYVVLVTVFVLHRKLPRHIRAQYDGGTVNTIVM